jgi:transcriptional regulator with XRE-family HTH domain
MQLVENLRSHFSHNLTKLREQNNLTQAGLADALNERYNIGLKRASIANYELGEAMPKIEALWCIAEYFGKSIDELVRSKIGKPVLIHPWMIKDYSKGEGGKNATDNTENLPDLNALLQDYADAIANRQFYVEFSKSLLQQFQDGIDRINDSETVTQVFKKTYLDCLIGKSKYFRTKTEEVLQGMELQVFIGLQEGSTVEVLSEALQITKEEVIATFDTARAKIISAIEKT